MRSRNISAALILAIGGLWFHSPIAPTAQADDATTKPVARAFVLIDAPSLLALKQRVTANDPSLQPALDDLRKKADDALAKRAPTVTDKKTLPYGNDKHDYMSLAIYFWPNPNTKDGKPYVNRDGEVNHKEVNEYDAPRQTEMINSVRSLAMAYYLFDDPKYADGAVRYLRTWFLDPDTRMNPNLNHAQFVPGSNEGRGYGIIESRALVQLTDSVQLLDSSTAWTATDRDGFKKWMSDFVDWLLTSKNGHDEASATNNHGEWFDAQVCGLARYLGRDDVVRRIATEEGPKRIAKQVEPDGSLPRELARTRSLHYTLFAIDAWMQVAKDAQAVNVDVYHYQSDDGRSLKKALDYVTPYMLGEKKWEHEQLGDQNYSDYVGLFRSAAKIYNEPRFDAVADALKPKDPKPSIDALIGG